MRPARRFWALNREERALVVEAALLVVACRAAMMAAFPIARGVVRRASAIPSRAPAAPCDASRVAWATAAVSRYLPGVTTCLVQALVVDAMLRRRRCVPDLRVGVKPGESHPFPSHAWVELEGRVLIGATEDLQEYVAVV